MTAEQQATYLNAIPLIALGGAYLGAALSLVPVFLRDRERLRDLEVALALVFPCVGGAALILGIVVLAKREPIGGEAWATLVAIVLAFAPVLAFFARFRDRSLLVTAPARARAAEERGRLRDAATLEDAASEVADRAAAAVDAEVGVVMLIDDEGREAWAVAARQRGEDLPWTAEARLDLVNEPSGVASAYHDAAPFAVYDAGASTRVNAKLVERAGAQSLVYVPMLCDQQVIAVIVVASTSRQRAFANDELAELQSLAAEAAPVIERLRRGPDTSARAERDAIVAELSARVRAERDVDVVLAAAVEEVARALDADRCLIRLGDTATQMPVRAEWHSPDVAAVGESEARLVISSLAATGQTTLAIADIATASELRDAAAARQTLLEIGTRAALAVPLVVFGDTIGVLSVHRRSPGPWTRADVVFAESVAREAAFGLHTAQLVADNARRVERQTSLLQAAEVLTSELEFERVLERLVKEVVVVVGADAADCWLFEDNRRELRCRAVEGLPPSQLGRRIPPEGTIADVVRERRAVLRRDFARTEDPPPSESYRKFAEVMDAPIVVHGDVRGVLGTCSLEPNRFDEGDLELLDTFASLASLALRNAEAFEDRSRQAQIQRGFYRIASVLGEPLSLSATFDALAQAAGEAFGGLFAVAVAPRGDSFELLGSHAAPEQLLDALTARADDTGAVLRHAAEERRIVATSRIHDDERFSDHWRALAGECGFGSLLVVPVDAPREEDAALVVVFFAGQRALREGDFELAHHLAQAARGSLQRSQLFDAERTSRSLAQQLARTGSVLATELDPAAVLDEVVEQAPALLGADACAIATAENGALVVVAASGPSTELAVGTRFDGAAGLVGEVVQSRQPVAIEDATADPALAATDPVYAVGYMSYLGVPLVGPEGALHGVLSLYGRKPRAWRAEEVEALLALAANTSAALSNAELYQRVAIEKERGAAILENIADGIVAVDRDGNVVLWNRAAEQVTGVPASEALGRDPQQLLGRTLTGAALVPIVRGGGEIWLSVTEAVMRDPAGAVAGRIFAFRDISAERLVEEMKSEFVATVSHELRGPLTSIYGFAETLLRQDVLFGEEERRVFLGYIASESGRLTTIVDALLSVARLDTGDLQVELAPTDVAPLVNDVISSVGVERSNGHDFVVELPSEPLAAEADPEKLRQVLAHLVENAVRYSPDGGRVTVAARRNHDTVEFHVADEGIGIPAAERERIFRKFYRANQNRGGTGLGLFIAQGLVNAMGGRIWVESSEGEGSRFAFELPAARV